MYAEALTHYERAVELTGSFQLGRAIMAHALAVSGNRQAAEEILSSLLELSENGEAYSPPYGIALIYTGLNDNARAIDWLEKAFAERFIWLAYLDVDPVFDGLRQDFRFTQLLKRMRFPHQDSTQHSNHPADESRLNA